MTTPSSGPRCQEDRKRNKQWGSPNTFGVLAPLSEREAAPRPPSELQVPTGGPVVIVLPLSLLSEMWDWEKQSGFSPTLSDPHKTHPTPLTESSSLSWGVFLSVLRVPLQVLCLLCFRLGILAGRGGAHRWFGKTRVFLTSPLLPSPSQSPGSSSGHSFRAQVFSG